MKKFTKKYQIWTYADNAYTPTEYDTIEECLLHDRYTADFYITQSVEFEIKAK